MAITIGSHVVRNDTTTGTVWTVTRVRGELLTIENGYGSRASVDVDSVREHVDNTTHALQASVAAPRTMRCVHCGRRDVTSDQVCPVAYEAATR